jgi:hypothetical protein
MFYQKDMDITYFIFLIILNAILLLTITTIICFIYMYKIVRVTRFRIYLVRKLIDENDGIFSLLFIFLFAIEQVILILLIYIFNNPSMLKLIVSIFALVVITTASLQKFILETKRRYEKEKYDIALKAKGTISKLSERIKELKTKKNKI